MMKRWMVIGILLILICSSFPIFASTPVRDPHVLISGTQGLNGWYISYVSIVIYGPGPAYYNIDNQGWLIYMGGPIWIGIDGRHTFNATDNLLNPTWTEEYQINIDTTLPLVNITKEKKLNSIIFTANATDATSGMNYVEFYINGVLKETDREAPYQWSWNGYVELSLPLTLTGFTKKPTIIDNNITIPIRFGIGKDGSSMVVPKIIGYDNAGNNASSCTGLPHFPYFLIISQTFVVPNHYTGYLGRFFVHATFQ